MQKGAVRVALLLRDVYEDTRQRFQLQLLAGERGLTNCMRWVYVSEDYTTSEFLYGGELILTTGVLSGKDEGWLLKLLHSIFRQHACGLIVNEGPYLDRKSIPPEVLDFCNTEGFPLFAMPWHIHIYDITRDYCDRIFTDARRDEAIGRAFLTLLDREAAQGPALRLLADQGFAPQGPYYVVQLQISPEGPGRPGAARLDFRLSAAASSLCAAGKPQSVDGLPGRWARRGRGDGPSPANRAASAVCQPDGRGRHWRAGARTGPAGE